jgi:hypothetical protein
MRTIKEHQVDPLTTAAIVEGLPEGCDSLAVEFEDGQSVIMVPAGRDRHERRHLIEAEICALRRRRSQIAGGGA